jgi:hypothetical protein
MTICIRAKRAGTGYASAELARFLREYTPAEILAEGEDAERCVTLEIDPSLPAHHYSLNGNGKQLEIRGGNASSVLCGVCDALSDAGILFEATGYSAPFGFDPERFFGVKKTVRPKFRLRGIRQHINFPMDISSYSLREAKEYIRSLSRMRFNAITFHSYPGQWHANRPDDPRDLPGHFFYGQVHPVPANDPLTASRIGNRKIYCIPEAEEIFGDEAKRAEFAVRWLNEVMKTAKEAGMTVTLSAEIHSDDVAAEAKMLRALYEAYPLVDTIELITEECGGFRELGDLTRETVTGFLTGLFGEEILDAEGKVPGLPDYLPGQLGSSAVCLKNILRVLEHRDEWQSGFERVPDVRAGLYLTDADTLRVLRPILRRFLPEGVTMSLLPAHGALAAADNIEKTGTVPEDWQNTMFYSWAEFDGNMYLQQLSTDGIEKLCAMPEADSSYGLCINHWRTAENTLTLSYAAEAAVSGMPVRDFYLRYAQHRGIGGAEDFADAMRRLALLDTYNRDNLFNIGFCYVGCWLSWHRSGEYMLPRGYPADAQKYAIAENEDIAARLRKLLPGARTKEGIAFLRLMINRCGTSVLHIRSMLTLEELREVFDFDRPAPLSGEQAEKIDEILRRSRKDAEDYLHLYGEILPDRGGEGQLVSYYETTLVYIDAVASALRRTGAVLEKNGYDAPPMPDPEAK